jgi:hypothetical protein
MVGIYYLADSTQQERYGLELQLIRFVVDAKKLRSEEASNHYFVMTLAF